MDHGEAVPIAELVEERRYLLEVAYWMLGSPVEAERAVDETYRRWYSLPDAVRGRITQPRSWLARTAGGFCLDRLAMPGRAGDTGYAAEAAARAERAEDVQDIEGAESAEGAEGAAREAEVGGRPVVPPQEVSRVVLHALDCLSPAERAAFVLNDVFGMTPDAIAAIVGRTEPECAELADQARTSLRLRRARPTTPAQHDALAHAVREACVSEDADRLAALLSPDATAFFDGGGKVRALTRPVHGDRQVAHSLLTLLAHRPRTTLTTHAVNGATGLVARYHRQVAAVISFDIADQRVVQVWVVLNPDKLRPWNRTPSADNGPPPSPLEQSHRRV